jgi:uncharacterized protein (DUF885 family)
MTLRPLCPITTISCLALSISAIAACGGPPQPVPPATPSADGRVTALADAYLSGYFERYPDQATVYGVPGRTHDRLPDNSLQALESWHAREDRWLDDARSIDPAALESPSLQATYAIVREALEGSVGARRCRNELWNVSQITGWQVQFGYLVTIQPVGSAEARQQALARWESLPHYLDVDIDNLREGLRSGYSAPANIVRIVIGQVDGLIAASAGAARVEDSPFRSPAARDGDEAFRRAFERLLGDRLLPAFRRYRDFLATEYVAAARAALGVDAHPDGAACYDALVRQYSSLPVPAAEVQSLGERQMDGLTDEMSVIAKRSFKGSDVPTLLQRLRTDRRFRFRGRQDLITYSAAALERAKAAAPGWFGRLPKADVVIQPYPAFREKNGANEYNPPAEDGSRPGLFYINAYRAEGKSRALAESTAFHETIPGHHLQTAIAMERRDAHPIGRYVFNSGYAEGWGLYAERLADEMQLYSSDLDRLGMLASQALRAARLVVDPGIHTRGWTRQQAIDYMLAHTAEAPEDIASEVDRYIIWPGQADSYMLGVLEIQRARDEARRRVGASFSLKAFHDRVLEDGAVPLTFLTAKLRRGL